MAIIDEVTGILHIKIKPRQDSYSDQFSRIFLLKVMFIGALFTGISWYSDKINCLIPKDQTDVSFVSSACWINGVYIYEEIRTHSNDVGYYGLPRTINTDGVDSHGALCSTELRGSNAMKKIPNPGCTPMKKTFFLQYQYMTFFLIALGSLYYAPYTIFKFVNSDLASLKSAIKDGNAQHISENFFNHALNPPSKMTMRIFGNIIVKLLYIISNVLAFILTDIVLNGRFQSYGIEWNKWSKLNNTMAYDYMGLRLTPKPGDVLLPSFALCDIHEAAKDIKITLINKHRFICEMNQHILYQYVFIIIWWVMIIGLIVSVIGFILLFVSYILAYVSIRKLTPLSSSMEFSIRECEYLEYIRRKNLPVFGEVMQNLKSDRQPGLINNQAPRPQEEKSSY